MKWKPWNLGQNILAVCEPLDVDIDAGGLDHILKNRQAVEHNLGFWRSWLRLERLPGRHHLRLQVVGLDSQQNIFKLDCDWGKHFWYKSLILLLLRARISALHNFLSKYDNDENQNKMPLTVTWCVAIGAGKTLGTWNSLTHTVAHVAGRRWNQPVKKSSNDKSWPMRVVGEHL